VHEAANMHQSSSEKEPAWQELGPQLDAALAQLSATDRDALLLRYFERKTAREIGQRLGVSEDAAQKRVIRALNQLRGAFADRGLPVTASALLGALSVEAVQAAPAALAPSVTATALATVASTSTLGILTLVYISTSVVVDPCESVVDTTLNCIPARLVLANSFWGEPLLVEGRSATYPQQNCPVDALGSNCEFSLCLWK
jgi:hypothetical protein